MTSSAGTLQRGWLRKPIVMLAGLMLAVGLIALTGPAAHAAAGGTTLSPGQTLSAGQALDDQNFQLVLGTDGNLVIDQRVPRLNKTFAIWATGTPGHPGAHLSMQTDGNLVLYASNNAVLWSSGTAGHNNAGIYAVIGSDGQIYVQTNNQAFWVSGTAGDPNGNDKLFAGEELVANCCARPYRSSENGAYALVEEPGYIELVHAVNGTPNFEEGLIWYKGQNGFGVSYAAMQSDSNFVEYAGSPPSTYVIWASSTPGNSSDGAYLKVQSDGNVVIYNNWGRALWSTGT